MRFSLSLSRSSLIFLLLTMFMVAQIAALPMAGYRSELEEELKALANKILEARNHGGKEEEDRMLKNDGWHAGGGFLTQMHPDGHGQLRPVQRIPISQMEQYVSVLENRQNQQTRAIMGGLGRRIAHVYNNSLGGGTGGVARVLALTGWKVSQDERYLVRSYEGVSECLPIGQMEQYVREYGLPRGVTLSNALREVLRTPASARQ